MRLAADRKVIERSVRVLCALFCPYNASHEERVTTFCILNSLEVIIFSVLFCHQCSMQLDAFLFWSCLFFFGLFD